MSVWKYLCSCECENCVCVGIWGYLGVCENVCISLCVSICRYLWVKMWISVFENRCVYEYMGIGMGENVCVKMCVAVYVQILFVNIGLSGCVLEICVFVWVKMWVCVCENVGICVGVKRYICVWKGMCLERQTYSLCIKCERDWKAGWVEMFNKDDMLIS